MKKSLSVALTGGIGAGKSFVAREFAAFGIPTYVADARAKYLMEKDPVLRRKLLRMLGSAAYADKGVLNKAYLKKIVFGGESHLPLRKKVLNAVHEATIEDYQRWLGAQTTPYVLCETALVFETGRAQDFDSVILVTAPRELRLARVLERDSARGREEVEAIMARQHAEEEVVGAAHFVVENDKVSRPLRAQILEIHQTLTEGG